MKILQSNELGEEIRSYWTERAKGYSEYNQQEMADARRIMWKRKLLSLLEEKFQAGSLRR